VIFFEILLEGASDVPTVREILTRRFNLIEGEQFRVHPHKGKGNLPVNSLARPNRNHRGLLDQLPAKLRGYASLPPGYCVVVLVDSDKTKCQDLKNALVQMNESLDKRPHSVLFRIAVEETESWFLADIDAVRKAYPKAKHQRIAGIQPDSVVSAWERLAEALGRQPLNCDGSDKYEWAEKIAPHLDLDTPRSPSLEAFVNGVARLVESNPCER
jgi:hypothetical protein